jgi:hypothetical protein
MRERHFQAAYGELEAVVDIQTPEVIDSGLPRHGAHAGV